MYRDSKIDQWELIISKDHIFMITNLATSVKYKPNINWVN